MTKNTFALILVGGAAIASASLGMAACSSDSTNPIVPGPDSSKGDTSQPMDDGGNNPDTSGNPDSSPACTHGAAPKTHPSDGGPGSLFCGYGADSGPAQYCDPKTQICCIGGSMGSGFAPDLCQAQSTPCTNGTGPHELDCEAVGDCTGGKLCCYTGPTPTLDTACNYYYAKSGISTKCSQTCAPGDIALCSSDAECGDAGKKCTPFKTIFFGLGFCQ